MKLIWSVRSKRRAAIVDAWWREHAEAPNLFVEELQETLELVVTSPKMGTVYPSRRRRPVLRVLMAKTQQYVYYSVGDARGEIWIVTIWGTRRGRGPKL